MSTSNEAPSELGASGVRFSENIVYITLTDGREIGVPMSRYAFLAQATDRQRANLQIEPPGFAVYWPDLDDGLEVIHLLTPVPMP